MITVWDYFWALISFFLPSLTLFSSMSPFAPPPTEEGPKGPPSLRRSWRDGRVAPRSSSLLYLNILITVEDNVYINEQPLVLHCMRMNGLQSSQTDS